MAAMDSPGALPESPLDENDMVYPCKGCGNILEEGKAFELAGNRWHIDCFRCNTCGTLLDSDANLLLLGDGSLICNNCTYSCNACGNKIEDLAILTGDQAFCAACFRCRNCKRKIENLRYARTSQGIFCMSCHESLMARRRKKAKQKQPASGTNGTAPVVLDKSLPALPPSAVPQNALQQVETPGSEAEIETPTEASPRSEAVKRFTPDPMVNIRRDVSPIGTDDKKDNLTLPSSRYGEEQRSSVSSMADNEHEEDERGGFLPMAFDPNPAPAPGLPPISRRRIERRAEYETPQLKENAPPRDYFNGRTPSKSAHREMLREEQRRESSRSVSREREELTPVKPTSPHIAYQEKGRPARRRGSGNSTPMSGSAVASPAGASTSDVAERPRPQHINSGSFTLGSGETFKLQEAPKTRKASMKSNKDGGQRTPDQASRENSGLSQARSQSPASIGTPNSGINPFDDPKLRDGSNSSKHPARGDSLAAAVRKPVPGSQDSSRQSTTDSTPALAPGSAHGRSGSTVSAQSPSYVDAPAYPSANGSRSIAASLDSPLRSNMDIPPRNASRTSAPSKSVANGDFIAPRVPPPPPLAERNRRNESVSSLQSEGQFSPSQRGHLPKHSLGGDFSMEDEMARIMKGDERRKESMGDGGSSVLRRVSNAVRHGRSFSDRTIPTTQRTPTFGQQLEISSPLSVSSPLSPSLKGVDDLPTLRAHLRRANQRIAELESDKLGLEEKVNSSVDIKQVNTELREKRSTMAFLDTQREMVVRELEIMTEHLTAAKESNQSFDISVLKSEVMQDFARSLQKLKDTLGVQIEDLVHKRNQLTDEISNLIQVKDKGLQEFESLSSKNNQLNELNAQLVHNIQEMYKANRVPNGGNTIAPSMMNGLGIYTASKSDLSSTDFRSTNASTQDNPSMHNLIPEANEAEPATILSAPQVVNIRKGQPKRFNFGRSVAKNVTKGLKGAFAREVDQNGMPYPPQAGPGAQYAETGSRMERQGSEGAPKSGGGYGFFGSGQKNSGLKPGVGTTLKNSSSTNLIVANDPSQLFGSELSARCDFEKRIVPSVVTRCIEEVEARGMDVEGVYRKSGGSGQVKTIQMGFEKDGTCDISDPDLDIHAVTSCLKQYFRKLPNPLITYDIYDSVLEAVQVAEPEKRGFSMKAAIGNLPPSHKDVLEYLVHHLTRVVEKESQNLMTPLNISVVFAPTIMRPLSIEREMTDMQAQRDVVRALLDNADVIFD